MICPFRLTENLSSKPVETLAGFIEKRSLAAAFAGYGLGAISVVIWFGIIREGYSPFGFAAAFLFMWMFAAAFGYFAASIGHLYLDLSGGKGKAAELFIIFGLSEAVNILLIPAGIILAAASKSPGLATFSVFCVVSALQLYFVTAMVRRFYGTSAVKSWTAVLLPFIIPCAVALALIFFAVAGIIAGIIALIA